MCSYTGCHLFIEATFNMCVKKIFRWKHLKWFSWRRISFNLRKKVFISHLMRVCIENFMFTHVTAKQCEIIIDYQIMVGTKLTKLMFSQTVSLELCVEQTCRPHIVHWWPQWLLIFLCASRRRFAALRRVNGPQSSPCAPSSRDHALLLPISTL